VRGEGKRSIGVGVVQRQVMLARALRESFEVRRDTICENMCLQGSTGRRLRDGNFGALRAASRSQYSQRAIRTPSDKKTTEPMGRCYPPLPKAARKSIMPTLAALSLHHLQTAIAAHRSLPPSQAAITVRYCFPHLELALPDARHLRRPLDATLSTANPVCLV
jgi:hypothetical protein